MWKPWFHDCEADAATWRARPSDLVDLVSGMMQIISYVLPLVTIFPLEFYNQLLLDRPSQQCLYAFWIFPATAMLSLKKYHRETYFYPMWLTLYILTFIPFLWRQVQIFQLDVQKALHYVDWPWVWSAFHVEFCIVNVIVTDLIFVLLGEACALASFTPQA